MDRIARIRWIGLLLGIIGMIIWFVAFSNDPSPNHHETMAGYLWGFVFWGSMTIGAFALMLLQGSLRAAWGNAVIRILEAAGGPGMMIWLFVFFVPLALPSFGLHGLYPWSDTNYMLSNPILKKKMFYLTENGFWIRTVIVLAIWILFSFLLKRSSRRQDETLDKKEWALRSNWGSPGIAMFFITIIAIATDWVMSIQPMYFSTIYPIIFGIGSCISALALAVLIVLYNSESEPYRKIVNGKLNRDFGNMYLALTMLWAYTTLSQFLITWEGNLPLEAKYYLNRTGNDFFNGTNHVDWNVLSNIVLVFQFFIPFLALLAPRVKRITRNMIWLSAFILVARALTDYWLVFPDLRTSQGFGGSLGHWTDYVAFIGIGGLWLFFFVNSLTKAPLLPKYDTRLLEVAEHA